MKRQGKREEKKEKRKCMAPGMKKKRKETRGDRVNICELYKLESTRSRARQSDNASPWIDLLTADRRLRVSKRLAQ